MKYKIYISCLRQGIDRKPKRIHSTVVKKKELFKTLKGLGVTKHIEQVRRHGERTMRVRDMTENDVVTITSRTSFKFKEVLRSRHVSDYEETGIYDHYFCTITPIKGRLLWL